MKIGFFSPLLWYYVVALLVPIVNGSAKGSPAFAEHAVFVLVVPLVMLMLGALCRAGMRVVFGARK